MTCLQCEHIPVVNRCSFRWLYKGPEQSGHFNRGLLHSLMRYQTKRITGNRYSPIKIAIWIGLMHSSVGVPLYLIQIQNNANSKSHEPKSRQIAPFDFNSWSCETTSKLALNSCSSAAEFFTIFFPTELDALYKKKRVPCSEGLRDILNFAAFRNISPRLELCLFCCPVNIYNSGSTPLKETRCTRRAHSPSARPGSA